MRFRLKSGIVSALIPLTLLGAAGAAFAAVPPYEPDPGANGTVSFYNSAGVQVTSGLITDTSTPAYALATAPGRSGSGGTDTKATLFGYSPVNGVPPGGWSGEQLSLSTTYLPSQPGVPPSLTASGLPLAGGPSVGGLFGQETNGFAGLAATFPNNAPPSDPYYGLYQLRLRTSGPHIGSNTVYETADIKITGNTWTQVYPVPVAQSPPAFTADTPPVTATVGVTYTYTFKASGNPTPTFTVSSGTLPAGLTLNSTTGVLAGTPTTAGSVTFTVRATNVNGTATTPVITITTGARPAFTADTPPNNATTGFPYSYTFKASGSPAPTFALNSGVLPTGVTLSASTGVLSGKPTVTGTFTFTIKAVNSYGTAVTPSIVVTVSSPSAPHFTAASPPVTGTVGVAYSYTFVASGSPVPTYTVASGALPAGLTLASATGSLSGTPTVTGTFTFAVRASNGVGVPAVTPSITVTVNARPVFTASTPPTKATKGFAYSYSFMASGSPAPTFALNSGVLPTGVTLNASTGVLSGTPSVTGTFTFTIKAVNVAGTAVTPSIVVTVSAPAAPAFTASSPPVSATVGVAYSYTFVASGSPVPTYTVASGALPAGLTLASATGSLSGTPTVTGTFTFAVRASNGVGVPAVTPSITVTVYSRPVFTASTPPTKATKGFAYSYSFKASGSPAPTFALNSGVLPTGVTLNASTGVLSGTPSVTGTFTFTIKAVNVAGTAVTPSIVVTVSAPAAPVFTADTPPASATHGVAYSYTLAASGSPAPTYAVASGTLPTGLSLNATTGGLSGTPTAVGTFTFTIRASNGVGTPAVTPTITITVN